MAKRKRSARKRLVFVVIAIITGSLVITFIVTRKGQPAEQKKTELTSVTYKETITPNAYGNFLAGAVKGFYSGGSVNGTTIPAYGYYPSAADIKNQEWTKKHMPLSTKLNEFIASGKITYEPKGCNKAKPSGTRNKCTDFVIRSEGKILFDSSQK